MVQELEIGSHLISPRIGYSHHSIYIGKGKVIHYSGLADGLVSGPIEETELESFSGKKGFTIRTYKNSFSSEKIVQRAKSRLGENSYSVFNNNCEHFCLWCVVGEHTSAQVDRVTWVSAPSVGAIVGLVIRRAVAASGAGIMSKLGSAGALVGGGAVVGVGVLGAGPGAAVASLVNSTILADNPSLEKSERESRAIGRVASYAGVGTATAGSIAAISSSGTVAGLSATGITSGLAAIGGAGGMAAGVFITTAAPVAAAVVAGYGIYKLAKWLKD